MSSGCTQERPAKFVSSPRIRSSSSACPTDSWICSASWAGPMTTSAVPPGACGAPSSATASSPTRVASSSSPSPRTYSHPAAAVLPWNEFGKLRRCAPRSSAATASSIAPVSTRCCDCRDPSESAKCLCCRLALSPAVTERTQARRRRGAHDPLQQVVPLAGRDLERVDVDRHRPGAAGRRARGERDRGGPGGGGRGGHRPPGHGLRGAGAVERGRGEAPDPVAQHPDAEPGVVLAALVELAAEVGVEPLLLGLDEADVGEGHALAGRRRERLLEQPARRGVVEPAPGVRVVAGAVVRRPRRGAHAVGARGKSTHARWRCDASKALIVCCTSAPWRKSPWFSGPPDRISVAKSETRLE